MGPRFPHTPNGIIETLRSLIGFLEMSFVDDLSLLVWKLDILKAGYLKLDILEAGYFSWIFCAETLEVNTLEAGLKSTSVMEVTLHENATAAPRG